MSGKLIVVSDHSEQFCRSNCDCDFCLDMHNSVREWNSFVPKNQLQKRMMQVVANIEAREIKKIDSPPLRRSQRL